MAKASKPNEQAVQSRTRNRTRETSVEAGGFDEDLDLPEDTMPQPMKEKKANQRPMNRTKPRR